jgi:transglutaminase-like putative cysteine protease
MPTRRFLFHVPGKAGRNHSVFPLPQSNEYQDVTNLSITPQGSTLTDTFGNKILVMENTTDIHFQADLKSLEKEIDKNMTLSDYQKEDTDLYMAPDAFINGSDKTIIDLTDEVVGDTKNVYEIVRKLYDYTLTYLTYGKPIEGLYTYKQAYDERITDCGGYSTLLSSLLRARGIPTRLVVGHIVTHGPLGTVLAAIGMKTYSMESLLMHAWLEVLLPDKTWFPLDPSMEWRRNHNLTTRGGGWGAIPPDRLVLSYGEDITITVDHKQHTFPLLQHPQYL